MYTHKRMMVIMKSLGISTFYLALENKGMGDLGWNLDVKDYGEGRIEKEVGIYM